MAPSAVISAWKKFDLAAVQRELDGEAAQIATRQDDSDAARRRLVDLSRDFKKTASEDVKAQVAPLLKSFQAEIDNLNKRSNAAEVTFLSLYKRLTDVTDPVPLLELVSNLQSKVARLQDTELEVKQLRDTLQEYNEEFRQVRNQEVTIKQLKERVRQAEEGVQSTIQIRLAEQENQLRAEWEENQRQLIEQNHVTSRRLNDADAKYAALQASVTELQSELFDAKARSEEIAHAKSDEIEMLIMDLDRANQRAALAEKELSVVKEKLVSEESTRRDQANDAPPIMDTPLDVMGRPTLQLELAAKEKEVQALIEDVQRLQSTLAQLRESSTRQLARFEEELEVRSRHIQRLEAQLENQKDYQEIRRELSILKSIEFPHLPATASSNSTGGDDIKETQLSSGTQTPSKPLEVLLLERNKALQSENTALKVANTELQEEESTPRTGAPLEETSPPSPPPSSSSSASPVPPIVRDSSSAGGAPVHSVTAASSATSEMPTSTTRLSLPSPLSASAMAAAVAAAAASGAPAPPFPSFGSSSASSGSLPRHLPPVFHPALGLGSLGHFLNEDMLLHWRRSLEASMLSQHQQQQIQQNRSSSPAAGRPSSPGASSENGDADRESSRQQSSSRAPSASAGDATSATANNSSTPGLPLSGSALPGWPSWEDSHLARLQQEFIARGGVYPGFGASGANPAEEPLASLMSLPEGLTSLLAKSNPLEARLQEMLRATMERYSSQALDTLAISRGVRELLSMHNIGQRLFAKFVLGLSQGTVSELLSKPKPWDKLTEKGRDSYRKMHAWACDEAAILLLKSLIPRKGKEANTTVATKTEESAVTEERIAHILNEASAALRAQQVDESTSDESKPPSQTQSPSPGPKVEPISTSTATTTTSSTAAHANSATASAATAAAAAAAAATAAAAAANARRGRKPDHDDISQEQVLRIYQEELAKMMSGASPNFNPVFNPALSGLSALSGARAMASNIRDYNRSYASALFDRTPEEIRLALDVYQQELNRLMQPPTVPPPSAASSQFLNAPTSTSVPVSNNSSTSSSTSSNNNNNQPTNGLPQDLSLPKSGGRSDISEEGCERADKDSRSKFQPKSSENGEVNKAPSDSGVVVKTERPELSSSVYMSHSLQNILRPSSTPSPDESPAPTSGAASSGGVASPLQRIASITNSLMSQPSNPTLPQVTQRPMKAILPPITQQQFDTYQNLNTEDIVKKVKEQLSQYSISQRLFGESVLGLSQGSVSDLLARPKPWHMLTQKGREPFIRMKIFLEDENAVHKLVASQYKIAPEKLMRTGGYAGSPQSAALKNASKLLTPTSMSATSPAMSGSNQHGQDLSSPTSQLTHPALALHALRSPALSSSSSLHGHNHSSSLESLSTAGQTSPSLSYGANAIAAHFAMNQSRVSQLHSSPSSQLSRGEQPSALKMNNVGKNTPASTATGNGFTPSPKDDCSTPTPGQGHPLGTATPPTPAYSLPSHSVYELAALTQDLDTQGMTTKIKEVLLANNIGQKIFGEAVLGLSQGSVSELLSKPKPWHMLSIKGREPFIRMQLWLSDPRNIEHIQRLKTERREAGKRRRDHSGFPTSDVAPNSNASSNTNSSMMGGDNSSNEGSMGSPSPCGQMHPTLTGPGGASLSSSSPSPAKKQRILFSEQQKEALKLAFSLDPYPSTSAMEFLGQELNLSTRTITNWFHNHRMRLKQQQSNSDCKSGSNQDEISPVNGGRENSGQFDPIHFRLLFHQRLFEMQASEENSGALPGAVSGLAASLPNLAGNLNMMATLGMPYPFYATGMLSQFCMGLNNTSPDLSMNAEGLDLSLGRVGQRLGAGQSESDAEDSDCESDMSNRTNDLETSTESRLKNSIQAMINSKTAAPEPTQTAKSGQTGGQSSRRSRKPAAPQWVNPHWQSQTSPVREPVRERASSEEPSSPSGEKKKKTSDASERHRRTKNASINEDEAEDGDEDDDDDEDDRMNQEANEAAASSSSDDEKMDEESSSVKDHNEKSS